MTKPGQASRKVDFIIAGVQKGATTALHYFLRQHPDIYLPDKKELHFFDNETIDWTAPSYEKAYHNHFRDAPQRSVWGEATPIYTYWRPSAGRIHIYNPKIKIIVSLRDPVARAYSHWRMEVARNAETLSFSQAIREGRDRVARDAEMPDHHRVFSYVERGFYAGQIKRLLSYFKQDQLFFLTSRDLFTRHIETLDQICAFLEVPKFREYPAHKFVFSNNDADIPPPHRQDIRYLRNLYYSDLSQTHPLIGRDIEEE